MVKFSKYQGLGNDFIVIDSRHHTTLLSAAEVVRLCDRHYGIGADGVLSLHPCNNKSSKIRVQIQNSDGSEASMCGNGLRCVAAYLCDNHAAINQDHPTASDILPSPSLTSFNLSIGTSNTSTYACQQKENGDFCIAMGQAALQHPELPMRTHGNLTDIVFPHIKIKGVSVWVGNPHYVIDAKSHWPDLFPVSDKSTNHNKLCQIAQEFGPQIESHFAFPNRVNVSFTAGNKSGGIDAVVYERGAGITQACGSGACAIAVSHAVHTKIFLSTPLDIHLLGGRLRIEVDQNLFVTMAGSAKFVYSGSFHRSEL